MVLAIALPTGSMAQFSGLDPDRLLSQYTLRVWDRQDGLPTNGANAIAQSPEGYIWVATFNGLSRFDGMNISNIDLAEDMLKNGNAFIDFFTGKNGEIWVATEGNGLLCYSNNRWQQFTKANGLGSNTLTRVFQDSRGTVWAGAINGLAMGRNGRFSTEPFKGAFEGKTIYSVTEDLQGHIWVATAGFGLYKLNAEGQVMAHLTTQLPSLNITALAADKGGNLLIGTDTGIYSLMKNGEILPLGAGMQTENDVITTIFCDSNGGIWIGSRSGLMRYANNRLNQLEASDQLKSHHVSGIFEDREGNIWVTTYRNGFYCFSQGKFTTYTVAEGLPGNQINHLLELDAQHMLIATNKGLSMYDGYDFSPFPQERPVTEEVLKVFKDSRGHIWYATFSKLYRLKNGKITDMSNARGLPSSYVRAFLEDHEGNIWLGTRHGAAIYNKGVFEPLPGNGATLNSYVSSLYQDLRGTIWIASNNGLYSYVNGQFISYTTSEGLPSNIIFSIYEDQAQNLWLGTQAGVARINRDTTSAITRKEGLKIHSAFQLLEDRNGFFWITSNQGIYKVARSLLLAQENFRDYTPEERLYDKNDGMKVSDCTASEASVVRKDGSIWVATQMGIVVIEDPAKVYTNPHPPKVVIESVLVNGTPQDISSTIDIPPGTQRIVINYTALNFLAPEKVEFRYVLHSFEQVMRHTSERQAIYTNLPPGNYEFRLMAANGDGAWTQQITSISVHKNGYFYQKELFQILLLFFLLAAAWLLSLYQGKRARRKEHELQQKVDRRTRDLQDSNEKINLQREEIEATNKKLEKQKQELELNKQQLEMTNRELLELNNEKNQLIGIVAHDLKSPLNQINGLVNIMKIGGSKVSEQEREQYMEFITASTERLNSMISRILDIEAIESKQVILSEEKVDLQQLLAGVLENYRSTACNKEITLHYQPAENDKLYIRGDAKMGFQVFANLLSNAIKFSPAKRNIYIELQKQKNKGMLRVQVRDEGQGITPDDMQKLFGKYQKLSARPTAGEDSTGLGLSIVKKYVEAMGGRVWCESEPGKGASFIVELKQYLPSVKPAAEERNTQ